MDWSVNDQYQFGWFVPPLALALLCLRFRDRPSPKPAGGWIIAVVAGVALSALLPLRILEEPNGDWRLLLWLHAGALCALSLTFAAWSGGSSWVKHFAFPVLFLLLAVPWPSGPEQALVQTLMRSVAGAAAEGLNLLGLPATAQGNLIRVREQVVGVNEACSGIRSLQTVLMAALMLGELSRLSWLRRIALLAGGIAFAMIANVLRSAFLVWIAANNGADALKRVHDSAGLFVLLAVFGGLLSLNKIIDPRRPLSPAVAPGKNGRLLSALAAGAILVWLVAIEGCVEIWYKAHESNRTALPTWSVALPTSAASFQTLPVDDVTRAMLRYDDARTGRWRLPGAAMTAYFFRWEAGRTSATLATMHQPTVCLPATGLTQVGVSQKQSYTTPIGVTLPVEQYEFALRSQRLYVYYVVWQDRTGYELAGEQVGWTQRVAAAVNGQRNLGQQTLELILTGPATQEEADTAFAHELGAIIRPKA